MGDSGLELLKAVYISLSWKNKSDNAQIICFKSTARIGQDSLCSIFTAIIYSVEYISYVVLTFFNNDAQLGSFFKKVKSIIKSGWTPDDQIFPHLLHRASMSVAWLLHW